VERQGRDSGGLGFASDFAACLLLFGSPKPKTNVNTQLNLQTHVYCPSSFRGFLLETPRAHTAAAHQDSNSQADAPAHSIQLPSISKRHETGRRQSSSNLGIHAPPHSMGSNRKSDFFHPPPTAGFLLEIHKPYIAANLHC
jgi:hypothetical protein